MRQEALDEGSSEQLCVRFDISQGHRSTAPDVRDVRTPPAPHGSKSREMEDTLGPSQCVFGNIVESTFYKRTHSI